MFEAFVVLKFFVGGVGYVVLKLRQKVWLLNFYVFAFSFVVLIVPVVGYGDSSTAQDACSTYINAVNYSMSRGENIKQICKLATAEDCNVAACLKLDGAVCGADGSKCALAVNTYISSLETENKQLVVSEQQEKIKAFENQQQVDTQAKELSSLKIDTDIRIKSLVEEIADLQANAGKQGGELQPQPNDQIVENLQKKIDALSTQNALFEGENAKLITDLATAKKRHAQAQSKADRAATIEAEFHVRLNQINHLIKQVREEDLPRIEAEVAALSSESCEPLKVSVRTRDHTPVYIISGEANGDLVSRLNSINPPGFGRIELDLQPAHEMGCIVKIGELVFLNVRDAPAGVKHQDLKVGPENLVNASQCAELGKLIENDAAFAEYRESISGSQRGAWVSRQATGDSPRLAACTLVDGENGSYGITRRYEIFKPYLIFLQRE